MSSSQFRGPYSSNAQWSSSNYGGMGQAPAYTGQQPAIAPFSTVTDDAAPLRDSNNNPYAPKNQHQKELMTYLGIPPKPFEYVNPFYQRNQEYYTLPEAYVGPNQLLTKILISKLTAKDLWQCTLALPWKEHNTNELQWDIWKFNDTLPDRTPEEAVSRMMTSTMDQGREGMIRQGIALAIEHGFYETPKGRMHFRCQLMQMDHAIGEGHAMGAQIALLKCRPPSSGPVVSRDPHSSNGSDMSRTRARDIENFARSQKDPYGVEFLQQNMDKVNSDRNGEPGDLVCYPQGMLKYLSGVRPEYGSAMYANGKSGGYSQNTVERIMGSKQRYVMESRAFKTGASDPVFDPMFSCRTIGNFFHRGQENIFTIIGKKPELFQTRMMDCYYYCEDEDTWWRFDYLRLFHFTGVYEGWDNDDYSGIMLSKEIGAKTFGAYGTYGELYRADKLIKAAAEQFARLSTEKQQEFVNMARECMGSMEAADTTDEGSDSDDSDDGGAAGAAAAYFGSTHSPTASNPFAAAHRSAAPSGTLPPVLGVRHSSSKSASSGRTGPKQSTKQSTHQLTASSSRRQRPAPTAAAASASASEFAPHSTSALFGIDPAATSAPATFNSEDDDADLAANRESWKAACGEVATLASGSEYDKLKEIANDAEKMRALPTGIQSKLKRFVDEDHEATEETRSGHMRVIAQSCASYAGGGAVNYAEAARQLVESTGSSSAHVKTAKENSKAVKRALATLHETLMQDEDNGWADISASWTETSNSLCKVLQIFCIKYAQIIRDRNVNIQDTFTSLFLWQMLLLLNADAGVAKRQRTRQISAVYDAIARGRIDAKRLLDIISPIVDSKDEPTAIIQKCVDNNTSNMAEQWDQFCKPLIDASTSDAVRSVSIDLLKHTTRGRSHINRVTNASLFTSGANPYDFADKLKDPFLVASLYRNSWDVRSSDKAAAVLSSCLNNIKQRYNISGRQMDVAIAAELCVAALMVQPTMRIHEQAKHIAETVKRIGLDPIDVMSYLSEHQCMPIDQDGTQPVPQPSDAGSCDSRATEAAKKSFEHILDNIPMQWGGPMKWLAENNVQIPFGVLAARPHVRYEMGDCYQMSAHGQTGYTFFFNPNFQLADDIGKKVHYGHFTMYSKNQVLFPERVVRAENCVSNAYFGGNGHAIWDPLDQQDLYDYQNGNLIKSVFLFATLSSWSPAGTEISITGRFPEWRKPTALDNEGTNYGTAEAYTELWGFMEDDGDTDESMAAKFNVICMRTHVKEYEVHTQNFTRDIPSKGHWGDDGPGVKACRGGGSKYLPHFNYTNSSDVRLVL